MLTLDFDSALRTVLAHAGKAPRPETETVPLLEAAGRILAEPVTAPRDQPPFDRATRDGFAVRAAEFAAASELRVIGEVRAGARWAGPPMAPGEAIAIMTGAPVPEGADSVVMIEHVEHSGDTLRPHPGRTAHPGENIVPRGSEASAGQAVLTPGTPIHPAEIALAASCGRPALAVYKKIIVAIVATGDELVELASSGSEAAEELSDQSIWNSNSYALAALVTAAGGSPARLPIARDSLSAVRESIARGRKADLLLLSGGVSAGKYDLVEQALAEAHAVFLFTGVHMQPGKPVVFGLLPPLDGAKPCFFFGLPGNPISTQVTFHCFVEPMLRALSGAVIAGPAFVQATLAQDVPAKPDLMRLLPARLTHDRSRPEVSLVPWQGSGDIAANARANCYAVFPGSATTFHHGDIISVLPR